jgi:hypothetical protein
MSEPKSYAAHQSGCSPWTAAEVQQPPRSRTASHCDHPEVLAFGMSACEISFAAAGRTRVYCQYTTQRGLTFREQFGVMLTLLRFEGTDRQKYHRQLLHVLVLEAVHVRLLLGAR